MNVAATLRKALPRARVSDESPDKIAYARDLWPRHHLAVSEGRIAEHAPGAVVWPDTAEDAADVVRICAEEGIPVVPFGAGSGVCGGVLPGEGAVVLDLKRLSRWRALDREAMTLEVEAGALGIRLEEELGGEGLTLGHFPSSILCSTVGGWVAARSAGQCSGLYGKIEDMVASLECVLGRGELVRLHSRVSGPSLVPIVVGSEGTLGVVTSAKLRVHPAPASRAFAAFSFASVEAGWEAMRAMFQAGLRPAVSRLYDPFDSMMARMGAAKRARRAEKGEPAEPAAQEDAGEAKEKKRFPGAGSLALRTLLRAPHLLNEAIDAADRFLGGSNLVLVFEGRPADVLEDRARASAICEAHGARPLGEEPARHWLAHRYSVSYRQAPVFMAGAFADTMEVAAPWSRLGDLYASVRKALGQRVFVMAHLSHAYPDGCSIYFTFAGAAKDVASMEQRYDEAWRSALAAAIAAGGTLSHHHGVGRSKAPALGAELGAGVDVVRALQRALDPAGIMNPGNLLPREGKRELPRPTPPPAAPLVDRRSRLVSAPGAATLAEIEREAAAAGLTLALGPGAAGDAPLADWLARGAPSAPDPWLDPADHLVAGFSARLASGTHIEARPAPRRAVGPDLFALFFGTGGRAGDILSAHLRLHGADPGERPRPLPASLDRDPPLEEAESRWLARALEAASATR